MEREFYDIRDNQLTHGKGYVYCLQYHIVWCTKYRRPVLKDGADTDCKVLLQELAKEYQFRIMAMEVMTDHIHLLIDASPQFCIPDMIRIMKGGIARKLFLLHPEMKTVSDRSREMVEHYIESQKEKAWGGRGRKPKDFEKLEAYHREVLDAGYVKLQGGDPEP